MKEGTASRHRLRYRYLGDRRRLGFELERLWSRITLHPRWPEQSPTARRALHAALDVPLSAAGDDVARLENDVRVLTARLVLLAKALRALDLQEPLPKTD